MKDYKELISALREEAEAVKAVEWDIPICTSNHIAEAADVIEQFAKERDAAIADLTKLVKEHGTCICDLCSHYDGRECEKPVGCEWEWRGVQEVEHAAD